MFIVDVVAEDASGVTNEQLEKLFHALHRLLASKASLQYFSSSASMQERLLQLVICALDRQNDSLSFACIETVNVLMQTHEDCDLLQQQVNKAALLSSHKLMDTVLQLLTQRDSSVLVLHAILDLLTFALCPPFSITTMQEQLDCLLSRLVPNARLLYKLFKHSCRSLARSAALVVKTLLEETDSETCSHLQLLALGEGALLRHLHSLLFVKPLSASTDGLLSCHLVSLWTAENQSALLLLRSIFPHGLFVCLHNADSLAFQPPSDRAACEDSRLLALLQQPVEFSRFVDKKRKRQMEILNWPLLLFQFEKDHERADLIWNFRTREELRQALESELRLLDDGSDLNLSTSWNYPEFHVSFTQAFCWLTAALRVEADFSATVRNKRRLRCIWPIRFDTFFEVPRFRLFQLKPVLPELFVQSLPLRAVQTAVAGVLKVMSCDASSSNKVRKRQRKLLCNYIIIFTLSFLMAAFPTGRDSLSQWCTVVKST